MLFEIDDLLGYLGQYGTLTGIQRVQVNILKHVLSLPGAGREPGAGERYGMVRYDAGEERFWRLDPEAVRTLIEHCAGDRLDRGRVDGLLRRIERDKVPAQLPDAQCYFVAGCFWTNRSMERYLKVKAAGLRIGVLLYDLIPLTHPEFCEAGFASEVALALGDGFALFDFVLAISEFSAAEARRYVLRHGLRPRPVEAVPLAHVVKDRAAADGTDGRPTDGDAEARDRWSGALAPLRDRPFALSVGTIEARKNHAYLLACWKLLREEGVGTPDLVLVGRRGLWVDDLMDQLRATRFMDGQVHVLHDLCDRELETLYRHCLFTAYVSFVEGWGLPVGESLAHGAPCVASGSASIPEVGGDLVDYVDPYCVRDGVAAFRRMIVDPDHRRRRRAAILAGFRARSWKDAATDLLGRIAQLRATPAQGPVAPLLRGGEVFRVGDLHVGRPVPANYPARPLRLVLAEGWHPIEDFGAWMRSRRALLRFATPHEAGTEVVLHLRLSSASRLDGVSVTISAGSSDAAPRSGDVASPALPARVTLPVRSDATFSTRLSGRVVEEGVVEVLLLIEGEVDPLAESDRRCLSVAIEALAYAPRADAVTRADLADAFAAG